MILSPSFHQHLGILKWYPKQWILLFHSRSRNNMDGHATVIYMELKWTSQTPQDPARVSSCWKNRWIQRRREMNNCCCILSTLNSTLLSLNIVSQQHFGRMLLTVKSNKWWIHHTLCTTVLIHLSISIASQLMVLSVSFVPMLLMCSACSTWSAKVIDTMILRMLESHSWNLSPLCSHSWNVVQSRFLVSSFFLHSCSLLELQVNK